MAATVLPKHYGPFPPWTHLTVETAHTGLAEHTVQLGLLWVLPTDVADTGLLVVRDKPWLIGWDRPTSLHAIII